MESVKDLVSSIKGDLRQSSASSKDEIAVMTAMLNDTTFVVDELGKDGEVVTSYCPAKVARELSASIVKGVTKMSIAEANELVEDYTFTKKEAGAMVKLSKEFVNTYLDTGRKINFGDREGKSLSLVQKDRTETVCTYPKRTGIDSSGKPIYQLSTSTIPGYKEVKANSRPK